MTMRDTAVVAFVLAGSAVVAQSTDLNRVLERTSAYLVAYQQQLTAVVAQERYDQWIDTARSAPPASTGGMRGRPPAQGPTRRSLVSDFLMIRWPGEAAWFGFRDVPQVDGVPVGDRDERLLALFSQNPKDVLDRADLIAAESARYNIGGVARNINVPTQALDVLHPRHRTRFHFTKSGEDTVDGRQAWKIEFEERERPYLVGTPSGQTQLNLNVAEARQILRTRITVRFCHEPSLGFRVPVELDESHEQTDPASRLGSATVVGGRAVYRNFRRFGTETQETLTR
jgi:hypothetical protein